MYCITWFLEALSLSYTFSFLSETVQVDFMLLLQIYVSSENNYSKAHGTIRTD